jgi:hypothetical protein
VVDAEAREGSECAYREVADDPDEFVVAEDASRVPMFVDAYGLAEQAGADGVGEPLLEGRHTVELHGQGRCTHLDGGGETEVTGGRSDAEPERSAFQDPPVLPD